MKFLFLLLLTSCASGGYHSYRDGRWHNDSDVTCAEGQTVSSGRCVLLKTEVAATPLPQLQPQQQPVIINNILPAPELVEESLRSSSVDDGEEGDTKGQTVAEKKEQILALIKEIMLDKAKKAIMGLSGNINIASPKVVGTVKLGPSTIGVGDPQQMNADDNEGIESTL